MSVRSRKELINQLKVDPRATTSNGTMNAARIVSPTSGKKYHIKLSNGYEEVKGEFCTYYVVKATCRDTTDHRECPACRGNSNGYVCKHSIATLQERLRRLGIVMEFCNSGRDACFKANMGGQVIKLISSQGDGVAWFVGKRVRTNEPSKVGPKVGIEMMRGNKDEVIE